MDTAPSNSRKQLADKAFCTSKSFALP
uniref:Uncharacterized protein n=1 Tax=Arundo donax TaxID=35708 RepID=A0A0A9A3Q9_ARUDO